MSADRSRLRPQSETQAALKLDEYNGAIFEPFADDALGWETQAIAVEAQRRFEVIDANGDHCDSRLHMLTISPGIDVALLSPASRR